MLRIAPPLRTNLQKSGYKAFKSLLFFFIIMFMGAWALIYSEGWLYVDGLYFAFQTSSTIGYGDQSSLYNYWPPNEVTGSRQGLGDPAPVNWGEITIGLNASRGEVPPIACIEEAQGLCSLSEDGTMCECTFSDGGKLILVVYFLLSAGSLAVLFDAALDYAELVQSETKATARRLSFKAAQITRKVSNSATHGVAHRLSDYAHCSPTSDLETGAPKIPPQEAPPLQPAIKLCLCLPNISATRSLR